MLFGGATLAVAGVLSGRKNKIKAVA